MHTTPYPNNIPYILLKVCVLLLALFLCLIVLGTPVAIASLLPGGQIAQLVSA
ncbi:hypothetical protein [Scytonema sp. NUACC21]